MSKPKITIVGAGAIGGWIAARLAIAGEQVSVLARGDTLEPRPRRGAAARRSGRGIRRAGRGRRRLRGARRAGFRHHRGQGAGAARPRIGAAPADRAGDHRSCRCSTAFPGGSSMASRWRRSIPTGASPPPFRSSRSIGCVVHAVVQPLRAQPHHGQACRQADHRRTGGGETSERVARAVRACSTAPGFNRDLTGNVRRAIWYKLWGNATINPLSALTRATADMILADPDAAPGCSRAWPSLRAIGAAIGCPISESGEDRMAVTAAARRVQDVDAAGRRGRPADRARSLARRAARNCAARGYRDAALDRLYGVTKLMAESLGLG